MSGLFDRVSRNWARVARRTVWGAAALGALAVGAHAASLISNPPFTGIVSYASRAHGDSEFGLSLWPIRLNLLLGLLVATVGLATARVWGFVAATVGLFVAAAVTIRWYASPIPAALARHGIPAGPGDDDLAALFVPDALATFATAVLAVVTCWALWTWARLLRPAN